MLHSREDLTFHAAKADSFHTALITLSTPAAARSSLPPATLDTLEMFGDLPHTSRNARDELPATSAIDLKMPHGLRAHSTAPVQRCALARRVSCLRKIFKGGRAMRSVALFLFSVAPPLRAQAFDEWISSRPLTNPQRSPLERTRRTSQALSRIRRNTVRYLCAAALVTTCVSCRSDDDVLPTAPANPLGSTSLAVAAHISAPRPLTPLDGAQISDGQPSLTVENATVTDDSTVTYRFQVASDNDFRTIVASSERVTQAEKQTSWRVTPPLDNDPYFWRARAENERDVAGPYSSPVAFTVTNAGIVVFDSLMDGTSAGEVRGGEFVAQGWQVTSKSDFIRYVVPTIESGFVEWENG